MILQISKAIFKLFIDLFSFIGTVLMIALPFVTIFAIIQMVQERALLYIFIPVATYFFAKALMDISESLDELNHQ